MNMQSTVVKTLPRLLSLNSTRIFAPGIESRRRLIRESRAANDEVIEQLLLLEEEGFTKPAFQAALRNSTSRSLVLDLSTRCKCFVDVCKSNRYLGVVESAVMS
jgi:hypothetical protein